MGTSEKAFNQVKSILGKLDRNIDQLREQRLNPVRPAPSIAAANRVIQQPIAPTPAPRPAASQYGRATPIPPTSGH